MDYKDIGHITRGVFEPGRLKVQEDGIYYKSSKTGEKFQIRESDFSTFEWMRAARGYEVKIISRDGTVSKFAGFKESDYGDLKDYFKTHFHKDLREVDLCVKGWNWGEASFRGSLMSFLVDNKPAFEVPLREVSQVTMGKNEVIMEFHQSEDAPMSLVEMRFHIPNTAQSTEEGVAEGEEDPVKVFHEKVLAKADVMQATGDAIVTFTEIPSLTPRGRYAIKAFPTFLQLHGKTFDYKIPYSSITRLFLLPHNDQRQMYFVIGLDPPIRQGQTRYYFVIFLLPIDEDCDVTLTLTEEEIQEKYDGKLSKQLSGTFYEVFSRVLRNLVGKKITVPGTFKSANNHCAISCSCRATSGYLYPLDKGFIFVHKPAIYIKFDAIASVNFARMTGGAGISRSFDFEVELKDGQSHHFSSLMKEDYTRLFEFVSDKNLRVKNTAKPQVRKANYDEGSSSDGGHDAYLERMKAEGEERDSEDEDSDFVAGESSHEELEYDSDAKIDSDGSENADEEQPKTQKRKKETPKSATPAKRKKKEPSGDDKKKKNKDPNAPKKGLSPYFIWLKETRDSIKRKYPGISFGELGKKAGEMWKTVSKSEWEQKAAEDKKRYEREMQEYKSSGAAARFIASSSSSPAKSRPKPQKPSNKKKSASSKMISDSKKFKSAEFINSDEDESSAEEGGNEEESSDDDAQKGTSTRSRRSGGGGGEGGGGHVSLPSGDEQEEDSEGEAELTSGYDEDESESD